MYKYTEKDARREISEMIKDGETFSYIRIFLNDLSRSHDITWEENRQIQLDILSGNFGEIDCSINTF